MKMLLPLDLQYIENDNLLIVATKALSIGYGIELEGRHDGDRYIVELWIDDPTERRS
jgi:hypothetical protein